MNKKYLLKNATIYDGSGSNPFKGNLLINNGKIEEIGNIDNVDAEVIDIKTGKRHRVIVKQLDVSKKKEFSGAGFIPRKISVESPISK